MHYIVQQYFTRLKPQTSNLNQLIHSNFTYVNLHQNDSGRKQVSFVNLVKKKFLNVYFDRSGQNGACNSNFVSASDFKKQLSNFCMLFFPPFFLSSFAYMVQVERPKLAKEHRGYILMVSSKSFQKKKRQARTCKRGTMEFV